ncbi:hypothetical protein [Parabacteroides sp. PF5-6]|uniref:InlB B-repeat-containing protein n=1 Tax=Parabacteroides sp. PF5-6 TaxID=1742403 RepID=UPI002404B7DA|nr:hypothetical protein [Parabacteroides sp. PF5-6]
MTTFEKPATSTTEEYLYTGQNITIQIPEGTPTIDMVDLGLYHPDYPVWFNLGERLPLEPEFTVPKEWKAGEKKRIWMSPTTILPSFQNKSLSLWVEVGVGHKVTHNTVNGTMEVLCDGEPVHSGKIVGDQYDLDITVTPDNTHKLALFMVNNTPLQDVEENQPYHLKVENAMHLFALCTPDGAPADGSGKGLFAWDLENATLTATTNGTPVANGEHLASGTLVDITLTPDTDMGMEFIRLNGEELDVTEWSFRVRIPDAENNKVPTTLIQAKASADGWKPGDPDPDTENPKFTLTYEAIDGSILVNKGSLIYTSGSSVRKGTELSVVATPDNSYKLALATVNGVARTDAQANKAFKVTIEDDTRIFALCTAQGAPADGSGKGLFAWDLENATLTATANGTPVANGEHLASGTLVDITLAPAAGMGMKFIRLNGEELDVTEWSFSVRIPDAENNKVAPTFIWAKGSADGWKPGDPDPDTENPKFTLTYEAIDGSILVNKGSLIYASGSSVRKGTELSVVVTPDNSYKLALATVNGVAVTDAQADKAFTLTIEDDTRIFALCTTEGAPADGSGNGLIAWDLENATLTATRNGTPVTNGEHLASGTIVDITLTPAAGMGMKFIRLNGEELDVTEWSFSVRIPDAENNKVAPTFIWAKGSADGWKPGDPDPDTNTQKYLLTYEAINGSILAAGKSSLVYASGSSVRKGTELSVVVTPDNSYKLALATVNGVAVTDAQADKAFTLTIEDDTRIFALCTTEGAPADGSGNGLIAWDLENATLTATTNGTPVANGEHLASGTIVDITLAPAAGMGMKFIRLNGEELDVTQWSFSVRIPDAENNKVAPTFIWAKGSADGWREGDPDPDTNTQKYLLTYEAVNGSLIVYHGSLVYPSGSKVPKGTSLKGKITPDAGYTLTAVALNDAVLGATASFETTMTGDLAILALCSPDDEVTDGKGRIYWNLLNGTLTAKVDNQEIDNGTLLAPGTKVSVTVAPIDPAHGILSLKVNGSDRDKTVWSFTVTIPEADGGGKVEDTFIWASFGKNGWKPGDPDPAANTYFTLEILETPEAITIHPAAGKYQIEEGSATTLRLTIGEQYDEKYIFLRLNEQYVLVKAPAEPLELSYVLSNMNKDMVVEVIVSDTENPNGSGSVSNANIENDTIRVWSSYGLLVVETPHIMPVTIYSTTGRMIAHRAVNGREEFSVAAGIYLIKAEKNIYKIVVGH